MLLDFGVHKPDEVLGAVGETYRYSLGFEVFSAEPSDL